jgi:protein disulfide-isomerase
MNQSDFSAKQSRMNILWAVLIVLAVFVLLRRSAFEELFYNAIGYKFPESKIPWREDFDTSLAEAKEKGKPVLLVFGATWCPPCKTMKRNVWPDEEVTKAVEQGFVPMYVDVDEEKHSQLSARYRVLGIPAVLVLNAEGEVLKKGNSMSRSETLAFLASN